MGNPNEAGAKRASEPKMLRGVIAKGRTVFAPTGTTQVVGTTADGKPVHGPVEKAHGPGETVTLPEHEVRHLRAAGFLVDPNAASVAEEKGPTVEVED